MKSVCFLLQNEYDFDVRVRRKAEALVWAGYSVDVLSLRGKGREKHYTVNGVNVYTLSLKKKRLSLLRYAFEYLAFFVWASVKLTVMMPRRHYVAVDVNTLPDFLIFAGIFARWMGAKLVLDMHEITPEFYMSKYGISRTSPVVRLLTFLERMSFQFADRVITINDPINELLISRGLERRKSTILMNTADESMFTSRDHKDTAPKESGAFLMMYHGTLTRIYGLDLAIEAFASVHTKMPGAEFWILGDGPELHSLRSLARERGLESKVKLLGRISPRDIPAYLKQCTVGVLPIRKDVFLDFASPNKLAEYIIMGKPVIISRLKAIQYYFGEHSLAYSEPNDPVALAEQMRRLYNDRELCSTFASNAKKDYSPIRWEVMRDRYLSLVSELCHSEVQIAVSAANRN